MTGTSERLFRFAEELARQVSLSDPDLLAAFRAVARGVFVPHFFAQKPGAPGWYLVEEPSSEWLGGVYSTDALVTQLDGDPGKVDAARHGHVDGTPTSSSSAPTLMALMLEALTLQEGDTVLEVGTGTGYNAALLCHRMRPADITSVDVDPALVQTARSRLSTLGYEPILAAADGTEGFPARAPYDRIIATAGFDRVPTAWIEQTRQGGQILVPLDRNSSGGLLALLRIGDGTAEGRFLPDFGGFMPMRAHDRRSVTQLPSVDPAAHGSRPTDLDVDTVTDPQSPFEFFAALAVGGCSRVAFTPDGGGPTETWLTQPDGSWVCHVTTGSGAHRVRQSGPRNLWDDLERAHRRWESLGRPERSRFGLTVRDKEHIVWLDTPDGAHCWALPRS